MSGMSFLGRLLDGVAVEWKPLGEVFQMRAGQHISASKIMQTVNDEYIYPCFGGNGVRGFVNKNSHDGAHLLIGRQGALCGNVQRMKGEFYATEHAVVVTASEQINIDWAFHLLTVMNLNQYASQSAQPGLAVGKLQGLKIPIPSLEVQAEIVRILDTFTALTAELTAELTARQKQYEYYRDRLLTFEKGEAEWKPLGEVALDFGRGKSKHRPRNDPKLYGGNTPFIQTGDIRNASHIIETYSQAYSEIGLKQSKLWPKGTLCITIAANIAETSILGFDACFPDSVIGFVANPEKTTSGYVEYLLSSLKTKLEEMGQGSAQSNINLGTFKSLRLPFPPLEEQARIVAILDKFDTLTTSISEGLPREIAQRQQQYEHYRDVLLTFPKPLKN